MLSWLTVISALWMTSILPTESEKNSCDRIKNGTLTLRAEEIADLSYFCHCTIDQLKLKSGIFRDLPPCFEGKRIESLHLEKIRPATFPDGILKLEGLKELSFRQTDLAFLPNEVSRLSSLKILDLRGTSISSLPEGLDHLYKIDLRLTELNKAEQEAIRAQYPKVKIYFSSPCNCH